MAGEARASRAESFVRFLAAGPAVLSVKGRQIEVEDPTGGSRVRITVQLLKALSEKGLVVRQDGLVRLTSKGEDYARRKQWSSLDFVERRQMAAQNSVPDAAEKKPFPRTVCESPLDRLRQLKARNGAPYLCEASCKAGERLRFDFTQALMQPSVTMRWDFHSGSAQSADPAGGKVGLTESAMAARRRFRAALEAVGPEMAGPLVDFCCYLKGLEEIERSRGWPVRSGKVMIRAALQMLARHYAPPVRSKTRHWIADAALS